MTSQQQSTLCQQKELWVVLMANVYDIEKTQFVVHLSVPCPNTSAHGGISQI